MAGHRHFQSSIFHPVHVERSIGKINLFLKILARRDDGFHELQTVLHPIPLFDELQFDWYEKPGIHIECSHPTLLKNDQNLIYRAARSFQKTIGKADGLRIRLIKNLPIAAGLGGGSSNAAATLKALNAMYSNILSPDLMLSLAAELGMDVPFFLQSKPALAIGKGEQIKQLGFFPIFQKAGAVLINPGFGISTAWAYEHFRTSTFPENRAPSASAFIRILKSGDWKAAMNGLFNSLEKPVFEKHPILSIIAAELVSAGASSALLSGSGATIFGIIQDFKEGESVKKRFLKSYGKSCWCKIIPLEI